MKKRRISIRKVFILITIVFYVVFFILAGSFLGYMLKDTPELHVQDFVSQETSKIYDCNGDLIQEVGTYFRDNTDYHSIPESLVDAFLSIEDSRYFQHNGFDVPRFTKVVIDALKTKTLGAGGSTFTMQLVKNTYFSIEDGEESTTREKTISYKLQQIYLSLKLERLIGKKEILMLYLNKLNFGKNIRGIQKASQYYFNKNCNALSLPESALLAGIVNLPNQYNPYEYLDYATKRRNNVLDMMEYHGYITAEERDLSKQIPVENLLAGEYLFVDDEQVHQSYIDVVLEEAAELTGMDPSYVGMNIYTAMNPVMQDLVEDIQEERTGVSFPDELMQTAIVSMDNRNGEVVAIGGGRNYNGARLLNRATAQFKQPGSSIKPVICYALAFEYLGYTLDEILLDKPVSLPSESRVLLNANRSYKGDVTLKDAVAQSLNIPAVLTFEDIVAKIGVSRTIEYMWSLGFSQIPYENFDYLYAIGGDEFTVSVMQMAGAHGAMINLGYYNKPHTIKKITTTLGKTFEPVGLSQKVLSSGSAWLVDKLMQYNVESGTFNYMNMLNRSYPVYAKTGTTDWGNAGLEYGIPEGAAKDKWMIASTSEYTNVVWLGWDQAVKGETTYFTSYYSSLNLPGKINELLLNGEEEISDGTYRMGLPKPEDLESITYVTGTYPHVEKEDDMDATVLTRSYVSSTGLENVPMVSRKEYASGAKSLKGILATISGTEMSIQWNVIQPPCSGSRDISLHDGTNNINAYGTCLVDYTWLHPETEFTYYADIYYDDEKVQSIVSENAYEIVDIDDSQKSIKVCGHISSDSADSEEACFVAFRKD